MGRGSYLARTAGGTKSGGAGGDRGARLSRGSGSSGSSSNIQARKQAADTMKRAGITGVGDTNKQKREDRGKRIEDAIPNFGGAITETSGPNLFNEIKEEKKENPFLSNLANAAKDYIGMGGFGGMAAKGISTIFDSVFKPKASTFKNQNNLSIINNLLKNENDLQRYYSQYRDVIEDAGFGTFDQFAADVRESNIPQGSEAQRRLNPEDYYDQELFVSSGEQDEMLKDYPEFLEKMGLKPMSSRFAQTTGNLVDIANIPVTPEMQGNNPEFAKRIFDARMELDRMGKDRSGNTQSVMSTPAFTIAPGQDAPPKPGPDTPDAPTGLSFTPQTTSPFDLSQFYAGLPNYSYGQQGVMNPNINPDLAAYFENLKKYYGVG
tara:strand:- start:47 stop:1180 length:1134 start_codon:yes stop_codon:yes gene_type:complete